MRSVIVKHEKNKGIEIEISLHKAFQYIMQRLITSYYQKPLIFVLQNHFEDKRK